MGSDVLSSVKELLNEEKWTRATIENYSRKNFIKLDTLIEDSIREKQDDELKKICAEHIKHSANSIISLYIIGILNYEHNALDNNYLSRAINLFRDNKKWSIVEFLADRILSYEENKKALKAMAAVYQHTNMEEELWRVWERLIKVDHGNFEIPRKLAGHYEETNQEIAVYYYKIALKRMLMHGDFSQFDEIWRKLVAMVPEDLDFFFSLETKLKGKMNDENIGAAYMELLPYYQEKDVDTAIEILNTVINYAPRNKDARNSLVEAFTKKYENHSRLEETITLSAIDQQWKPIEEALELFQRNIAFDVDDYIYHRSWKIGKITAIEGDTLTIDFDEKRGHNMDLDMALKSLTKLERDHIWIMARHEPEVLKQLAKEDSAELIRLTLESFGKEMNLKDMKAEIINSGAVTTGSWSSWWTKAKKVFKTNPKFGTSPDKKNVYFLREKPLTFEEDSINRFEGEKDFARKLGIFEDYLNHSTDFGSAVFGKMLNYFRSKANQDKEKLDPQALESILFLMRLQKQMAGRGTPLDLDLPTQEELYQRLEKPAGLLEKLIELENKKTLLQLIRRFDPAWEDIYINILQQPPSQFHNRLFDELVLHDKTEKVDAFLNHVIDHYRQETDHLVWMARLYFERRSREEALHLSETAVISAMINTMALLEKEIENKNNVGFNRKKLNTLKDLLFDDGHLESFISEKPVEEVKRVINVLTHVADILEEQTRNEITRWVKSSHSELDFSFVEESEVGRELHPFLVTQAGYDKKQAEYKHIVEVDIPENSRDIALAVEKGDLSENAEYKAALEHQEQLKARISQLDEEMKKARVIAEHDVTVDHIGFGNHVRLQNLDSGQEEELTLLGEWESEPAKRIISYKSPLGKALLFKRVSEEVEFKLEDRATHYKVLEISKADIF